MCAGASCMHMPCKAAAGMHAHPAHTAQPAHLEGAAGAVCPAPRAAALVQHSTVPGGASRAGGRGVPHVARRSGPAVVLEHAGAAAVPAPVHGVCCSNVRQTRAAGVSMLAASTASGACTRDPTRLAARSQHAAHTHVTHQRRPLRSFTELRLVGAKGQAGALAAGSSGTGECCSAVVVVLPTASATLLCLPWLAACSATALPPLTATAEVSMSALPFESEVALALLSSWRRVGAEPAAAVSRCQGITATQPCRWVTAPRIHHGCTIPWRAAAP
jgi:hypothetical protein